MPAVAPFRGLHYSLDRYGGPRVPERVRLPGEAADHPARLADLTDLACPPYDVIDAEEQAMLLARDKRNAVRLELNPGQDPHAGAEEALARWTADGTLAARAEPTMYYYAHASSDDPDDLGVQGVLARVQLEPWGSGVRPHEHTMPGPKADRLALLRATTTQFSPILAIYFDDAPRYAQLMGRAWTDEWRARDRDGLLHQLTALEPDDRLVRYLGRQTLFVADGHHRYETALAYQAEVRSDSRLADAPDGSLAADWVMMVLVNAELEELTILPTHRVVVEADGAALRRLIDRSDPMLEAQPVAPQELAGALAARADADPPTFGLVLSGDEAWVLTLDADAVAARMRREPVSTAVAHLDLAILHAVILDDRLGIDAAAVAAGDRLLYTRDAAEAVARVDRAEAAAALLIRPTRLDQLAAVATAGDLMPQKSTYFYPKLLTGLVFNPLQE